MPIRAAIYGRSSPDYPSTADQQSNRLKEVADEHGWTVARIFTDRPRSIRKGLDRRTGEAALLRISPMRTHICPEEPDGQSQPNSHQAVAAATLIAFFNLLADAADMPAIRAASRTPLPAANSRSAFAVRERLRRSSEMRQSCGMILPFLYVFS